MRPRYNDKALYGEKPLPFYSEPLRSELYAKVRRAGSDKDGKFDYDVAGRLVGGWFHESVPRDWRATSPDGWTHTLAFVYSEWNPDTPHVVSGGTVVELLVWWIDPADPDFREVSAANGIVRCRLSISPPAPNRAPDRILLVQLETAERLPDMVPSPTIFGIELPGTRGVLNDGDLRLAGATSVRLVSCIHAFYVMISRALRIHARSVAPALAPD